MSIYAISDLHLSFDENVDKPMDKFGPEWFDHAERLKENWEKTVGENDTVIIAGDISWGLKLSEAMADFRWIDALPGKKLIFKGNHDLWWSSITKLNTLFDTITFVQNFAVFCEGWYICGSRGWVCPGDSSFVEEEDRRKYDREVLRLRMSFDDAYRQETEVCCGAGLPRVIGVLHYPPTNDKHQDSDFTRMFASCGAVKVVYGHLHGKGKYGRGLKGFFNGVDYSLVSVDYLDCTPKLIVE